MVSYEVIGYALAAFLGLACIGAVGVVGLIWTVRKLTLGARGAINPENDTYGPSHVDVGVLAGMSERTAVLEGRYNALVPLIEGYGTIQARMSALEAHLPTMIDVTEKLTQNVKNADKRDAERQRRADKKDGDGESVGEAFAAQKMGLAAAPAQAQQPDNPQPQRRAGVVGQGGNGRPRS